MQQGEQGASLHADAGQARIEVGVAHVHDRPSLGGLAMKARDRRAERARRFEQAKPPQRLQAGRLQQEAGAHRARIRHPLEDLDLVARTRQRQRGGLAAGAITDDGDRPARHRAA